MQLERKVCKSNPHVCGYMYSTTNKNKLWGFVENKQLWQYVFVVPVIYPLSLSERRDCVILVCSGNIPNYPVYYGAWYQ